MTGAQADDLVWLPGGVAPLARGTESPVLLGGNQKSKFTSRNKVRNTTKNKTEKFTWGGDEAGDPRRRQGGA